MILSSSTRRIRAFLGGAVGATEPHWISWWIDRYAGTQQDRRDGERGVTAGATPVEIVPANADNGVQREVRGLSIYNTDVASVSVTVEFYDGSDRRTWVHAVLQPAWSLAWEAGGTWHVYDSNGQIRTTESSAGVSVAVTSNALSILSAADVVLSDAISNLRSAHEALSTRVSANSGVGGSVTSFEVSAVSAQAASAISDLRSAHDALSNRVSANSGVGGGASVTSNELSAVSAQAASALSDARSALSAKDDVLSNAVSALLSAHDALSNRVSANSGVGGGGGSVTSNEFSALEVRVSTLCAAPAGISVTSNELSAVSAQAASALSQALSVNTVNHASLANAISVVSNALSALEVRVSTLSNAASNALSVGNAASAAAAALSLTVSAHTTSLGALSLAVSAAETHASAASAAATSIAAVDSLARSVISAAAAALSLTVSAHTTSLGVMSLALSVLQTKVSADEADMSAQIISVEGRLNSVLSTTISALEVRVSTVSNVASNALSVANAASAAVAALSLVHSSLSTAVSALEVRVSALSGAAGMTSATVAAMVTSINNNTYSANGTLGLQSALNNLSSRIGGGGGLTSDQVSAMIASVASTVYSARSVTVSVKGIQSALNALSNTISDATSVGSVTAAAFSLRLNSIVSVEMSNMWSAVNRVSNNLSVFSVALAAHTGVLSAPAVGMVSTANTFNSATMANFSGMSTSISVGAVYKIEGMVIYCCSAATGHAFGLTFPTVTGAGTWQANLSVNPTGLSTFSNLADGSFDDTDTGSAVISLVAATAGKHWAKVDAVFACSTTGVVQVQGRASVSTNTITVHRGSYIRAIKIG